MPSLLFDTASAFYSGARGFQVINEAVAQRYWDYKILLWAYEKTEKIKECWNFTAKKISSSWNSIKNWVQTQYNYCVKKCNYWFNYDKWVQTRVNEERTNINEINNSEIDAQINYKASNKERLDNLKEIKSRLKKDKIYHHLRAEVKQSKNVLNNLNMTKLSEKVTLSNQETANKYQEIYREVNNILRQSSTGATIGDDGEIYYDAEEEIFYDAEEETYSR